MDSLHPHTYVRLPNDDVLATFQYHGTWILKQTAAVLVEFDPAG